VSVFKSTIGRRRAGAALAACAVIGLAVWGCDKGSNEQAKSGEKKTAPRYVVPAALDRALNPTELDSMRSMKISQKITRDEYWDGYGGVLANDFVEVWYPDGEVNILQGAAMLKQAMAARRKLTEVFGRAPQRRAVIICSGNVEMYQWATGRDWWTYSSIVGDTISVQAPIDLYTRGLLDVVGPREYMEWAMVEMTNGKAPRWVQEGFASYLAGEAVILEDLRQDFVVLGPEALKPDETERVLKDEKDRRESRRAGYNAYRMTEEISKKHGEKAMAAWINALAENPDLDAASQKAFGESYDALLNEAMAWASIEASP
jgi:hypothetical protein